MSSIAEQIADLVTPSPHLDPEEDIFDETAAKLVNKEWLDNDNDEPSFIQTPSRIKNFLPGRHKDPQYKGKVVSRKQFDDENVEDSSDTDTFSKMEDEDPLIESEKEDDTIDFDNSGDHYAVEDDEEIDSDEAICQDDGSEPGIFKPTKNIASDKDKGKDTMNQLSLWESILETRIKIQKLLALANQIPRPTVYHNFLLQGGEDLTSAIKTATLSLSKLGSVLFTWNEKLLMQVDDKPEEYEQSITSSEHFNRKDWSEKIDKRCCLLRNRRSRILKFWYDKTMLITGKKNKSFLSFERPTNEQIEHILNDRNRLIRRTRVQRTKYRVLGTREAKQDKKDEHDAHLKETEETFDDDDFYQHLLRQFIEQKTSQPGTSETMQDSIDMTRNWLKLQHLRTKTKKIVDTKASKGKKVRYKVHPKLVSYMAPLDKTTWTHDARNQLANAMFGKSLFCADS